MQMLISKSTIPLKKENNTPKAALQALFRRHRFRSEVRRTAPGTRLFAASLTVEAALVLPLFLFAMYLLILPLRMMDTAREMQQVCESVCQDTVQLLYLRSLTKKEGADAGGGEGTDGSGGSGEVSPADVEETVTDLRLEGALTGNAVGLAAAAKARALVKDGYVVHLLSLRSSVFGDGETVRLTLDYDYRLPFSVFGLGSIHQSVTAVRRAWTGRTEGGLTSASGGGGSADSETVYVGKNSTRYHSSPSCHYLSNDLTAVSYASVSGERNSGGKKYHPCSRCAKGVTGGTVYISPSGTSFHTTESCSAITSYGRPVLKSEVAHLGPCSYCCH